MGCMMTIVTRDATGPCRGGRMSRLRKREAVLRLHRGEDLETVQYRGRWVTAVILAAGATPS
jgi:transposase